MIRNPRLRSMFVRSPLWLFVITGLCATLIGCMTHKSPHDHDHGHAHIDEPAVQPASRVMGPDDIDGYLAEGWALMKKGQFEKSVTLLKDGLSHNPDAFQLHYLFGQVHFNQARQHATGPLSLDQESIAPWLHTARAAYAKGATLGLAAWEESNDLEWTGYLDTDLRGAVRMDAMMEYRFGNPPEAIRKAQRALALLDGDPILQRNLDSWQSK